jgi:phosphatidate cytidylyltransferase
VRSLSAAVFVVLLMGSLLWNYYSFTIFFFAVAIMSLKEFFSIAAKLGARPYKVAGYIMAVLMYLLFINGGIFLQKDEIVKSLIPVLVITPCILLAAALFSRRITPVPNAAYTLAGILYAVLPFALLHLLVFSGTATGVPAYDPWLVFGVILLIWSNDTFAYLSGSIAGRHKMMERISPGKTWEGTVLGVLITFGLSFVLRDVILQEKGFLWPVLGLMVPILATIGDLVQSMLKRQAGIKDSGSIMPGHGGVLDRFDSLIFVSPFVVAVLKLL